MQNPTGINNSKGTVLNGIRLDETAQLAITGNGPDDMTDAEIAVAVTVGRRISKMKRQGYAPAQVAPWIARWVQDEALAVQEARSIIEDKGPLAADAED